MPRSRSHSSHSSRLSSERLPRAGNTLAGSRCLRGVLFPAVAAAQTSAKVPICPGLTIVTAISEKEGDYESIKTIASVDRSAIQMKYSSEHCARSRSRRFAKSPTSCGAATPGSINRITTTYQPQANPVIDDGKFKFAPLTQ